jgi:hypothetical protein
MICAMIKNYTFLFLLLVLSEVALCQVYGTPLVTWDFSDGIPQDWQLNVSSTNNIAQWEYRGPGTEPGVTVGARGSCSAIAVPIQSQTRENGFIIFDGNYWDDPGLLCGAGFGDGPDPAPHNAWFVTNPIDLSQINSAVLTFQQQYRHFQATTAVYISIDGGVTWVEILSNTGVQSSNAEWKSINISSWAANQSSVQFKFQYSGTYYWWLLDDINVYEPNENDLRITKVQYTNNQITNGLYSLRDLEYQKYPISMLPSLKFRSEILNVGGNNQTGVRLNSKLIKNNTTEVLNVNSPTSTANAGAAVNLTVNNFYTPSSGIGDYKVRYTIIQNETDETPENNKDSLDFELTAFTYGKDEGTMEDTYTPVTFYDSYQLTCGNYFENKGSNRFCHTIQVGVAEGTPVGKEVRGVIYNESLDSLLASTSNYVVNYADLNEPGEERLIFLDFETPFSLQADSIYFVGVEEIDSIQPFFVARGGTSFGESSLVRYNNINASLISAKSFLVRLTILPYDEMPGCTNSQAMNYQASADIDDGSCDFPGCTNEDADNYAPNATFDNGSCQIGGCLDSEASNFNPLATYQSIDCIYGGCTDPIALNYDPQANQEDGTCTFLKAKLNASSLSGCQPFLFSAFDMNDEFPGLSCSISINGQEISSTCSNSFEYEFAEAGIFEMNYYVEAGSAVDDTTLTIQVFPQPVLPEIIYDAESHFVNCTTCSNETFTWQLNGEVIEGASNSSLNAEFDGITQNGYYNLISTTSDGCSISSEPLTVSQPHIAFSTPYGCVPFSVYIINTTDLVPGMTCSLNTGTTIIDNFEGLQLVTFEEAGVYTPSITCTLDDASGIALDTITAYNLEIPILSLDEPSDAIICENYASFSEFIWNIDGNVINGGISQPTGNSVYQLQAYNEAGCGGSTLFIAIGTDEILQHSTQLYPNPANDFVMLQSTMAGKIRIFNNLSQLVFESKAPSKNHTIPTISWPAGIYIIQWTNGDILHTSKFEIVH